MKGSINLLKTPLSIFSKDIQDWFSCTLGNPTHTQKLGWPQLAAGKHALICAPTGSGKTLCAFLLAIDTLLRKAEKGVLEKGVQVLYISPLKALGNDIAHNLDVPLEGIGQRNPSAKLIRKAVRTGDTPQSERRRQRTQPPHILITTPESLYLMLTSQSAQTMFSSLKTVIVDEVHALLESKRGIHLMLSLERLRCFSDFQRIGLTATVEPKDIAAAFIGGILPVEVVDARREWEADLIVESPVEDFRILPQNTIWPEIGKTVYSYAQNARQTLVFCNARTVTENVSAHINRIAEKEFSSTHHGSLDKERRLIAEQKFKEGTLRCLCATSSMELGIDVGAVDLVIQIGSPFSASRGLQRMGRSGHKPGETSRMRILPRMAEDALESAFISRMMLQGDVEPMRPPQLCLDVLAQHIVSMVCTRTWKIDEILSLVQRAYGYHKLSMNDLRSVLRMLRGDFEHAAGRDTRPRIIWNEEKGTLQGDNYSRLLAVSGSTIPDMGLYPVVTVDGARLGELDEAFVFEARVGDRFTLGAFVWSIVSITHDRVIVSPSGGPAKAPFWRGEGLGRPSVTGEAFGREIAHLESVPHLLDEMIQRYPVDLPTARAAARLLEQRAEELSCLPTDKRLIIEHFKNEAGECFWALHCLLGGRVNLPLSLAFRETAQRITGRDVKAYHTDDGILLHFIGEATAPEGLLYRVKPDGLRDALLRELPATPLFAITFRHAASTALMLGAGKQGRRVPLWTQRLRGAEALSRAAETLDHPLVVEAYRECLTYIMEVERAQQLLFDIHTGSVNVVEVHTDTPSHLTRKLLFPMVETEYTYYEATLSDVTARGALALEKTIVPEEGRMYARPIIDAVNADALYTQLLRRGTLNEYEMGACVHLAAELTGDGRALWADSLLVASHEAPALRKGLSGDTAALMPFLLRYIRSLGETPQENLEQRFGRNLQSLFNRASQSGELVSYEREGSLYWADSEQVQRAITARMREKRRDIQTQPPENYAALLPLWQRAQGQLPVLRIEDALCPLYGYYANVPFWEEVILPARVQKFHPRELDRLLMTGGAHWRVKNGQVTFFHPEQEFSAPQEMEEGPVYGILLQGGALFARQIAQKTGWLINEVEKELTRLMEAGLITCDGFAPLRKQPTPRKSTRLPQTRTLPLSGEGRWEAAGQPVALKPEEQILNLALRWGLICRECAAAEGVAWPPILEQLKRMEYRDEARRGYFVRGLSGAQFILNDHYERICAMLASPSGTQVLTAADPAQAYGTVLPGAGFSILPSTVVVMEKGRIVLTAAQHGARLLPVEGADIASAVRLLVQAFRSGRLWPSQNRITVRTYPPNAREALLASGFEREMLFFTLWKKA